MIISISSSLLLDIGFMKCISTVDIVDSVNPSLFSLPGNKFLFLAGDVTISGDMTLVVDSDLNGASPQFTLTCSSTGGPATTVTWTRDSATVTVGTVTVFNDAETAQYTHTLTVTERLGGDYQCTVSNAKPSSPSASASLRIQGTAYMYAQTLTLSLPYNVMCM